jgi:hypothetical protein
MLEAAPLRGSESRFAIGGLRGFLCVGAALVPVLGLAAAQGGFFPTSWGWASVPLLTFAVVALLWRVDVGVSAPEWTFATALIALTAWIGLSTLWSVAQAQSVLETERALVYVAVVATILIVLRKSFVRNLLGGLLAAIVLVSLFSLGTRVLPDRIGVFDRTAVYRLAQPVGYWNGLAIFTAMGAVLAFAFAIRARSLPVRALCAAALVLLLPTLYFTFGRAAWIALAAGLLASVLVDPRRLQALAGLLVVWPIPALGVWIAARERGLTHAGVSLARAAHDGHRVALVLLLLATLNATAACMFGLAERHVAIGVSSRRTFAVVIALAAIAGVLTIVARYGGPVTLAKKGYAAFKAPPPHAAGNLNRRLLSFSGNGRAGLWRIAWDEARAHPVLGGGAGSYERYFLAHQPPNVGRVRDAHSLYVETLAELGPIGVLLLIVLLATPFVAVAKARAGPLVPAAFGAYVAYLVHTGVDWDWELPGVTLVGLICASAILVAGRGTARATAPSTRLRLLATGALAAGALFAGIGLLGNTALSKSEAARERGDFVRAAADARHARFWAPWSPAPWAALGRAELGVGLLKDAQRSFRKAIAIDRGDWQLWYDLASASSQRARFRALQRATILFPRSNLIAQARRKAAKG